MQRRKLAWQALNKALRVRQQHGVDVTDAVDIFDFVAGLDIEVRFVDMPSLEAMYVKAERSKILVSSHRPPGRRVFNCAHELGHHVFNHGTKIDEYLESGQQQQERTDPEETIANRFASYFLMPKTLVAHAFNCRGWSPATSSPLHFYTVAGWLGVGYSTLIYQMRDSLRLLGRPKAAALLKRSPKELRAQLLGQSEQRHLTIVDLHWKDRAIDTHVEDLILVPPGTNFEGDCVQRVPYHGEGTLYRAVTPGIGRFVHPRSGWASYTRIAKQDYIGRSIYRYLPDPEYVISAALH